MGKKRTTLCPYCGGRAEFVPDTEVYRSSYGGNVYLCRPCKAWVGCHAGTKSPLGRLANEKLRKLKIRGHALFDPIWKSAWKIRGGSKNFHRQAAYRWLSDSLSIPFSECHFGMFDEERASKAIEFLEEFHRRIREKDRSICA